jgi:hypothetical protein
MANVTIEQALKDIFSQDNWDSYMSFTLLEKVRKIMAMPDVNWLDLTACLVNFVEKAETDSVLRAKSVYWLTVLSRYGYADEAICERVVVTQHPELIAILNNANVFPRLRNTEWGVAVILAANKLDYLRHHYDFKLMGWLVNAIQKGRPEIAERARYVLRQYKDFLIESLKETYNKEILEMLKIGGIEVDLHLMSFSYIIRHAIGENNWESLSDYNAKIVPELLDAFDEISSEYAYDVRQAIRNLTRPDAEEAVCRVFISERRATAPPDCYRSSKRYFTF